MQKFILIACGLAATTTVVVLCLTWGFDGQALELELQSQSDLDMNKLVIQTINSSSKSMTIVGAQSSCSCGYVTGLPISIPSGKSVSLGSSVVPELFCI